MKYVVQWVFDSDTHTLTAFIPATDGTGDVPVHVIGTGNPFTEA
jgi:hypothetical protein